ncbi:unnamed protein product [Acanthoscelides obtectus]|uniref:Uncharacterized protein n=1 Tax=Acanthoscelides obtectus TaxID=200917 RepID=A0A9P0MAM1_ACAOB|nr:unnamed protein product [Acanthoscelides obtectus]CAK1640997.1 hypothetical protein AOBTE_LOCUS12067 [Acanthoscelides obtectus]
MPKRSRKRSRSSSPSTVGEKFLKIVKRLEKRLDKMEEKRPRQWHHGSSSGTSNSEDGSDSHSYDRRSYSGSEADGGSDIGEKEAFRRTPLINVRVILASQTLNYNKVQCIRK